MKSMMLTGIRQMEMKNVPDPMIVNDTDVLIRMERLGICGSDVHYYTTGRIGSQVVEYPFPVGHEGAGTIVKTGSAISQVKPGDRVFIDPAMFCGICDQCLAGRRHTCRNTKFLGCPGQSNGSLSEYIIMPEACCYPIPDHVSFDEAAFAEPLSIGVYAVKLYGMSLKGKKIGILGSGPIGMSVLIASLAEGAERVYITDKIDRRLEIAKKSGASWTGNPDQEDIVKAIMDRESLALDAVFECCGQQEAMDQAVQLLKPGGKLMIVGIPEFDHWSFSTDMIRRKELCLQNVRRQNECVQLTLDMIADGRTRIKHLITHHFSFENTKEGFDMVAGYKDGVMKAMIDF
jgi:L-iditol 2-dehydrogenase